MRPLGIFVSSSNDGVGKKKVQEGGIIVSQKKQ